ncbi:hypothetical protein GCM10023096_81300 [Nonomuraea ferruginea]
MENARIVESATATFGPRASTRSAVVAAPSSVPGGADQAGSAGRGGLVSSSRAGGGSKNIS